MSTLLQRTGLDDHEEILKTCNAEIKKNKKDFKALHVKIVALLKLDRYDHAIHIFEDGGDILKTQAKLEYAYTLYKTRKLEEAAKISSEIRDHRGARHVDEQALSSP